MESGLAEHQPFAKRSLNGSSGPFAKNSEAPFDRFDARWHLLKSRA